MHTVHLPQHTTLFTVFRKPTIFVKALCLLLLVGFLGIERAKGQLFQQQFATTLSTTSNTSLTTGTYFASSPTAAQFTGFTSSGAGTSIAVASNRMTFTRSNANGWGIVRGAAFSGPPSSLMIQFDYSTTSSGGAATSNIVFGVGGGTSMSTNTTSITGTDTHSRISFNTTANATEFVVRDVAGSTNGSTTFSGTQTVLWVINNSGGTLTYKAPDGTYESVANDKFDVWVGTSKQLDEKAATSASQTLSYFKLISTSGTYTANFSNMVMGPIPAIPTSSAASNIGALAFDANWSAVSGASGYKLDVATDAAFTSFVSGYNNLDIPSGATTSYTVNSNLSASTTYYYRIRSYNAYTVATNTSDNSSTQNLTTTSGSPTSTLAAYSTQLSGSIAKGISNVALAGFTVSPSASADFTSVSITGSTLTTSTDVANVRIYRDFNGDGIINSIGGTDAVVNTGTNISFPSGATTAFTISGETGFTGSRSYIIVADISGTGTSSSVGVSIGSGAFVTTLATNSGSMATVTRSLLNSSTSDIIRNASFTEPTNVDYSLYQQATGLTTSNSLEIARFDIRDGGSGFSDADGLATTLSALTLSVANSSNIRRIAIFDGSTNIGEIAGASSAVFSSFSASPSASDGGSKTISVRVSYNSAVTDNQQIQLTVTSATASTSGSGFAAAAAGGAASDISAANSNKIVVTATKLAYTTSPPSTAGVNVALSPVPVVTASRC